MNYHNKNNNIILIIMQALLFSPVLPVLGCVVSLGALCGSLGAFWCRGRPMPCLVLFRPSCGLSGAHIARLSLDACSPFLLAFKPSTKPTGGTVVNLWHCTSGHLHPDKPVFTAFQLSRWLVLGLTACGYLQNGQKQAQGPFSGSGGGVSRVGRESARYRHQRAACGPHFTHLLI